MAVKTKLSSFMHHKECIMCNHILVTNGKCCVKCCNSKAKLSVSLTKQVYNSRKVSYQVGNNIMVSFNMLSHAHNLWKRNKKEKRKHIVTLLSLERCFHSQTDINSELCNMSNRIFTVLPQ